MNFHPELPASCPPLGSIIGDCQLFRAINGRQPGARDFLSHAEKDVPGVSKDDCQSWGLSVWPDMKAVENAIGIFSYIRKKHIISFSVTSVDGCVVATPNAKQPDHCTFWKTTDCNLLNSCQIVVRAEAKS